MDFIKMENEKIEKMKKLEKTKTFKKQMGGITFYEIDKTLQEYKDLEAINEKHNKDLKYLAYCRM